MCFMSPQKSLSHNQCIIKGFCLLVCFYKEKESNAVLYPKPKINEEKTKVNKQANKQTTTCTPFGDTQTQK